MDNKPTREKTLSFLQLAEESAARGDLNAALDVLNGAVATVTENPGIHLRRSEYLERASKLDLAIEAANFGLRLAPNHAHLKAQLAHLLNEKGASAEALSQIDNAIKLNPDISLFFLRKIEILQKAGQINVALECADRATAKFPNCAPLNALMSSLHQMNGDHAKAIQSIDQAIKLSDQTPVYWLRKAMILDNANMVGESISITNASIEKWPKNAHFKAHLAHLMSKLGDLNKALSLIDAALQLDSKPALFVSRRKQYLLQKQSAPTSAASSPVQPIVSISPSDVLIHALPIAKPNFFSRLQASLTQIVRRLF